MSAIEYSPQEVPGPGVAREVAPGVHWIRMPLPFRLDHINVWLLEDTDGWTIVDTGVSDTRTRDLWRHLFETKLGSRPVRRLIVTHHHVDHIGLAGWLTDFWGIELTTSRVEWLYASMLCLESTEAWLENCERFFLAAGMPKDSARRLRERGNGYRQRVDTPPQAVLTLDEGATLRIGAHEWRVMIGTGHTPAQVCLYCRDLNVLIGGDQVLPRISPNVSVWPTEPQADPLADYLASLGRFRGLPPDTLVLPSHDRPFKGLHARIDELIAHHHDRLQQVLEVCEQPASARDVLRVLFPRALDDHQMQFAVGEGLAHIHFLVGQARLRVVDHADGVRRYWCQADGGP